MGASILSPYDLPTPALLIDLDRAWENIRAMQAHADALGLKLRPHIKTHRMPYFATPAAPRRSVPTRARCAPPVCSAPSARRSTP